MDDDDDDDDMDFAEEQEQRQPPQRLSNRGPSKQDSKGRMADVQAAEDRLAALDLQLDSADNDLLLDDDPFAAEAEPRNRRQQQQRDEYGEDDDDRLFEDDEPPQRTQAQRGRADRREEHASTSTNLGAGLATLQKQRAKRSRGQ